MFIGCRMHIPHEKCCIQTGAYKNKSFLRFLNGLRVVIICIYFYIHQPICVWALFGRVCACASVLSCCIISHFISSSPGPASEFYNLRNLLANNTGRRGRWRWRRRTWDEGHTKWMFTVAICSWCILITCTVSVCLQSHRLPSPQSLLISLHFTINYCNRQQQLAKQCYGLLALLTF